MSMWIGQTTMKCFHAMQFPIMNLWSKYIPHDVYDVEETKQKKLALNYFILFYELCWRLKWTRCICCPPNLVVSSCMQLLTRLLEIGRTSILMREWTLSPFVLHPPTHHCMRLCMQFIHLHCMMQGFVSTLLSIINCACCRLQMQYEDRQVALTVVKGYGIHIES